MRGEICPTRLTALGSPIQRNNLSGVGEKLGQICMDFLMSRKVISATVVQDMEKGCPQVSSLGSTLSNVMMQRWFEALANHNTRWGRYEAEKERYYVEELMTAQACRRPTYHSQGDVRQEKWNCIWQACKEWKRCSNIKIIIIQLKLKCSLQNQGKRTSQREFLSRESSIEQ